MRLTKKRNSKLYPYIYSGIDDTFAGAPIDKLGQLEDIEDELGIDLITLFKALKNGIYRKGVNVYGDYDKNFVKINHKQCEFDIKNKVLYEISDINFQHIFPVKLTDYGKTWALTKEELLWNKDH